MNYQNEKRSSEGSHDSSNSESSLSSRNYKNITINSILSKPKDERYMLPPIGSTIKQISSSSNSSELPNNIEMSQRQQAPQNQQPNSYYQQSKSSQELQHPTQISSTSVSSSSSNSIPSYPSYSTGATSSETSGYSRPMVMQIPPSAVSAAQQQPNPYLGGVSQQSYASLIPGVQPQYNQSHLAGQQILPPGAPLHSLQHYHPMQQHNPGMDMTHFQEAKRGRRFRRRYNQIVRKYACSYNGCTKSYGSLNHLNTHIVTKKHGHRKSKADFQHSQNPEETHKSNNSYSEPAVTQVYQQPQEPQQTQQHQPQHQPLQQQSYAAGQNPNEYASGNYWYGYATHLRTSNSGSGSDSNNTTNSHAYQTAPQGYMYYQNYPGSQISQQVSAQRYPTMPNAGLNVYNSTLGAQPIYQQQPVVVGGENLDSSGKSRKDSIDNKPPGGSRLQ
ncbi:uncharacterized protein J8A68_005237 [[Candida] subhashii]|uniref:C2H2-type domain-containing protein n=1 Tax=[Candida] subhashii TaxID=561895 RepID=A0A8J5QHB6_9ASCO|nr:uncharacterized protein J8A68_005237 [[Candida] subhashii]KAG7661241.1 hypothetical protein J8A68_005237 [[Candida] subhashii]